jgi:2-polyprenyl-6-hydroxyphenyl methylase/3-demethylubiquinone-9 3-methyltransferase
MALDDQELGGQMSDRVDDVARGRRFEFGANWSRFLRLSDEERVRALNALCKQCWRVLTSSGSASWTWAAALGFSLAAARLGVTMHSFDRSRSLWPVLVN